MQAWCLGGEYRVSAYWTIKVASILQFKIIRQINNTEINVQLKL